MPASASIAVAPKATPMMPAILNAAITAMTMTIVGAAVDSRLIARPWMTLVPWPVSDAFAIDFTGR